MSHKNPESSTEQMSKPTVIQTWLFYATVCSDVILRTPHSKTVTGYARTVHEDIFRHCDVPMNHNKITTVQL